MQLQDKSPGALEKQEMVKLLIQCKGIPELPEELEGWKVSGRCSICDPLFSDV